jgi:hypothetical protein
MAWLWPVPGNRITQYPHSGHIAYDIGVPRGTPVIAPVAGTIEERVYTTGYGTHIRLHTDGGYTVIFGHLQDFVARPGQHVDAGQLIAHTGNTGHSSGPHLHLEVRNAANLAVMPQNFFLQSGNAPQVDNSLFTNPTAPGAPPAPRSQAAPPQAAPRVPFGRVAYTPSTQPMNRSGPGPASAQGAASGAVAAASAARKAAAAAPGITILNTPAGAIKIAPKIAWPQIIAGAAGLGLVFVGALGLATAPYRNKQEKLQQEDVKELLPLAASLVNPAAGVVASIGTSRTATQAAKRTQAAQKSQQRVNNRAAAQAARAAKKAAPAPAAKAAPAPAPTGE